jgi:hypothetical protein
MLARNRATIERDFGMNLKPLHMLRRGAWRHSVAVLATFALFLAGYAQAAHFHKDDSGRGAQTHLQCLLCLHADRWNAPPEIPKVSAPALVGGTVVVAIPVSPDLCHCVVSYDARGPPTV